MLVVIACRRNMDQNQCDNEEVVDAPQTKKVDVVVPSTPIATVKVERATSPMSLSIPETRQAVVRDTGLDSAKLVLMLTERYCVMMNLCGPGTR
jgi:hypothetical protein